MDFCHPEGMSGSLTLICYQLTLLFQPLPTARLDASDANHSQGMTEGQLADVQRAGEAFCCKLN